MNKPPQKLITQRLVGRKIHMKNNQQNPNSIQYQIVILDYKLSENALSTCNLGIIKNLNELVTIKKVENKKNSQDFLAYQSFKKRYQNQINNLCYASNNNRIQQHSNILNVYPISLLSQKRTHAYIVTQFCSGGNLESQINVRKLHRWFRFGEFYNIMKQLLNGYNQLYSSGILHQNIKPSSIFINAGYLKIGDFSFSVKLNQQKEDTKVFGNTYYTAPEKYSPNYKPSFMSDIYSIGIILYELIYHEHPYYSNKNGDNIYESSIVLKSAYITKRRIQQKILAQIIQRAIDPKLTPIIECKNEQQQNYLRNIINIVKDMIAKNPNQRITFEQLRLRMLKQLSFAKSQPIEFFNNKLIPKKLCFAIEGQSNIQNSEVKFQQLQLKDIKKNKHPKIYIITYQSQKINITTNFLYGVLRRMQNQIRDNCVKDAQILQLVPKILEFNYSLTYRKYHQILSQIIQLDEKALKQFYETNLDSIVDNIRVNLQSLQNQVCQLSQKSNIEQLMRRQPKESYKQMSQLLMEKIIQNKLKVLDDQNKICYLFINLLIKVVIKMGHIHSLQQIQQVMNQMKLQYTNLQTMTVTQIQSKLKDQGIDFPFVNYKQ